MRLQLVQKKIHYFSFYNHFMLPLYCMTSIALFHHLNPQFLYILGISIFVSMCPSQHERGSLLLICDQNQSDIWSRKILYPTLRLQNSWCFGSFEKPCVHKFWHPQISQAKYGFFLTFQLNFQKKIWNFHQYGLDAPLRLICCSFFSTVLIELILYTIPHNIVLQLQNYIFILISFTGYNLL